MTQLEGAASDLNPSNLTLEPWTPKLYAIACVHRPSALLGVRGALRNEKLCDLCPSGVVGGR